MPSNFKLINDTDPLTCRRSLMIHNLPLETKVKDLNIVIKRHLGQASFQIDFGKPYSDGFTGRRRAYVICDHVNSVNQLMRDRPIHLHGEKLIISREIPRSYDYYGHITSSLAVELIGDHPNEQIDMGLIQETLERHFRQFGIVRAREWIVPDQTIVFAFNDYDAVDQIILAPRPPMIQRFRVKLSKTLGVPQNLSPSLLCTHLTNLPADVTSRELASIFGVHREDVLIKPANPLQHHLKSSDQSPLAEAWIKGTSHPSKKLRGVPISSEVIEEPSQSAQFCWKFQQGKCDRLAGECHYQHTLCSQPDSCISVDCVYGHSFSTPRRYTICQKPLYRLKLTGLSARITRKELRRHLPKIGDSSMIFSPKRSETNVVYIVGQPSGNFLRTFIHQSPKFECQLETNEDFFEWDHLEDVSRPVPSAPKKAGLPFRPAPWCQRPEQ